MGSPDPRAYSRNKRGIAGSLIWIDFDRHALLALFLKAQGKFVADVDEIRPQYQGSTVDGSAIFQSSLVRDFGPSVGATIDQLDNLTLSEVGSLQELATPWYSDQILPFDITLAANNEYGASAACKIFGVEILNEGKGTSIDDAVSESQATFVARSVEPMAAVASPFNQTGIGGQTLPVGYLLVRGGSNQVFLSPANKKPSRARATGQRHEVCHRNRSGAGQSSSHSQVSLPPNRLHGSRALLGS